jgi:hypothetical protein
MGLDNSPADRQADPHSILLGGIKSFKELVAGFRLETDAHILHPEAHSIFFIAIRSDQ